MLANERISIAAHLHVLLRRKTGRVTDTEWMATNRDYAIEVIRFAHESAAAQNDVDLGVLANRFADVMALSGVPRTLATASVVRQNRATLESGFGQPLTHKNFSDTDNTEPVRENKQRDTSRYVAGLR